MDGCLTLRQQREKNQYEQHLVDQALRGRISRSEFMRRALGAGISLGALSAFLAACGGDDGGGGDSDSLRIIASGEPYGTALKNIGAEWGRSEGVEVTVDQIAYGQLFERLVLLNQSQSKDYDIQVQDCIWFATFMGNEWVANLDELGQNKDVALNLDAFVPGAVGAYGRDENGTLWSIPITYGMEVNAYRKDIYEKAGFKSPPETWDEFNEEILPKIHELEPGVAGLISMPNEQDATYSEWTVRLMGTDLPANATQFVWSKDFEPIFQLDGRSTKAIEQWLAIKPYAQRGVDQAGYADGIQSFSQGTAATMINWAVFFLDFEAPGTATAGKLGYALPPHDPTATDFKYYIGTFQMGINAASEKKDLAYRFMAYLTTPEAQEKMLEAGQPDPYLATPYSESKWIDRYPWFEPLWEARGNLIPLNDRVKEYVEYQRLVYEELQRAWFGGASPEEVTNNLVEKVGTFFEEKGYA